MMRSAFFAMGLFVAMWGGCFLAIDRVVLNLNDEIDPQTGFRGLFNSIGVQQKKNFDPPQWAAYGLMSAGAVTMLYSVALPKKKDE